MHQAVPVVRALATRPNAWVDFMMRFELGLEKPDPGRALTSAVTIGGSYAAGGLIPLAPYMLATSAAAAQLISVAVTMAALLLFGYVKGRFTGAAPLKSGVQTAVVGGLAAGAAYAIARLIS
jgi:vacuolar iron transporter family protein